MADAPKDRQLRVDLCRQLLRKKLSDMSDREIMWLQIELLNEVNLNLAFMVDLLQDLNVAINNLRRAS